MLNDFSDRMANEIARINEERCTYGSLEGEVACHVQHYESVRRDYYPFAAAEEVVRSCLEYCECNGERNSVLYVHSKSGAGKSR